MRHKGLKHNPITTLIAICLFAVAGCANTPHELNASPSITQADLLSGQALFDTKNTPMSMPDDDVMKLSATMRDYLEHNIPQEASQRQKLFRLLSLMFSGGNLGISYNPSQTLTAEDTFISGSGNCLAVSYLFASMAEELGLTPEFQNVAIPPLWGIENDIIYKYRHVNVKVRLPNKKVYVVDVDLKNNLPTYKTNRISRNNAVAQYYSNRGAHYLGEKDMLKAFLYFKKAIHIDPSQAEFWSNLGVLYTKSDENEYAESAYLTALSMQHDNLTTIGNLASLYGRMGKDDLKVKYQALAAHHNNKNPYLRYVKAAADYKKGNYKSSLEHIKWAIRAERDEPKFYTLLAEIYEETGEEDKAQSATKKSQKVAEKIKALTAHKNMKVRFYSKN